MKKVRVFAVLIMLLFAVCMTYATDMAFVGIVDTPGIMLLVGDAVPSTVVSVPVDSRDTIEATQPIITLITVPVPQNQLSVLLYNYIDMPARRKNIGTNIHLTSAVLQGVVVRLKLPFRSPMQIMCKN